MSVIRVEKSRNYSVISNVHLRDRELSLKAKGLLSLILSLPDNWQYSVNGLAAITKEGRTGIMSALRELEGAGYLTRHQLRGTRGRMGPNEYVIKSSWPINDLGYSSAKSRRSKMGVANDKRNETRIGRERDECRTTYED